MNPQPNETETGDTATHAVNTFTRRSFMKTSALTVGAVALLSQGTALALEGAASSSTWWDMHCTAPEEDTAPITRGYFWDPSGDLAWCVRFELVVQTNKLKDSPGEGYNDIGFNHTGILRAYDSINELFLGQTLGFNHYDLYCDRASGIMSSFGRDDAQSFPTTPPPCHSSVTSFSFHGHTFEMKVMVGVPEIGGIGGKIARFAGRFSGTADVYGPAGNLLEMILVPADNGVRSIVNRFEAVEH